MRRIHLKENIVAITWEEGTSFYHAYTGQLLQTIIGLGEDFVIEGDKLITYTPKKDPEVLQLM